MGASPNRTRKMLFLSLIRVRFESIRVRFELAPNNNFQNGHGFENSETPEGSKHMPQL